MKILSRPACANVADGRLAKPERDGEFGKRGACAAPLDHVVCLSVGDLAGVVATSPLPVMSNHVGLILLMRADLKIGEGEVSTVGVKVVDLHAIRNAPHERIYKDLVNRAEFDLPVSVEADTRISVANEVFQYLAGPGDEPAVSAAVFDASPNNAISRHFVVRETGYDYSVH